MEFTREIADELGAAFPETEIDFLPRGHFNGKARALPYIEARSVMRRLDAVVGPANWSFDFDLLSPDGKQVKGRLTVLGVTKCDAGEADTEDEVLKSAVSDALKRCGVHFGIGRYLYYLPAVWAPYDAQKRRFVETPRVDAAAVERALQVCGVRGRAVPAAGPARRSDAPALRVEPRSGGSQEVREGGEAPAYGAPAAGEPEGAGTAQQASCSQEGCGKPLTPGQFNMSVRAYGQPLCPACQKQRSRAA